MSKTFTLSTIIFLIEFITKSEIDVQRIFNVWGFA